MEIQIKFVKSLTHYAPLFGALEKLVERKEFKHIQIKYVETQTDIEVVKQLSEEKETPDRISLFLTSIPDISNKLEKDLRFEETEIQKIYDDCVLWTMLIDRTPLCVIGKKGDDREKFDGYWQLFNEKRASTKIKIACYPEGSTVDWFIHKSFNRQGAFEVVRVPFGEDEEFKLLERGEVDYAVTLEPWRAEKYNFEIIHDIPIAPFGFTGLLTHRCEFDNPTKRELLLELVDRINEMIASFYETFEPALYDWSLFYSWEEKVKYTIQKKEHERKELIRIIERHVKTLITEDALEWMCTRRIWAIDPVKPLPNKMVRHIKSANELLGELLRLREAEREAQETNVHIIHQLKSALTHKITNPITELINSIEDNIYIDREETVKKLTEVKGSSMRLSDKFKRWLQALNLKMGQDKNIEFKCCLNAVIEDYLPEVKKNHGLINIELAKAPFGDIESIENDFYSYSYDDFIKMPSVLIEFLIDEIVGNAKEAHNTEINRGSISESDQLKIVFICERLQLDGIEFIELKSLNTGTYIPSTSIASLGKNPTKSGTDTGTGFGLYFLNRALKLFDAELIDVTQQRYFLPENTKNGVSFKFRFKVKTQ